MKRRTLAVLLTLFLVPLAVACGDDDQGVIDGGGPKPDVVVPIPTGTTTTNPPDGSLPDGGGPQLFTDFVKGLVANETKADNRPTTVNDKTFAPDPEDPKAFPASFF